MHSRHDSTHFSTRALATALLLVLAACGPIDVDGPGLGDVATARRDAGTRTDSGDALDAAHVKDVGDSDSAQLDSTQLDSAQPDSAQPDTSGSDTWQPDASAPDTRRPDTRQPDTWQADSSAPDADSIDTTAADTARQDSARADSWQPDTRVPDSSRPDTTTPDTARPDAGTSDRSPADATGQDRAAVPSAWACSASFYGDGECDCGCGALDVDCASTNLDACEYDHCPANTTISHTRIWLCDLPASWACWDDYFVDGICDCGCGALDLDCGSAGLEACERNHCPENSAVTPTQNWSCDGLSAWTCPAAYFGDGECDCGCGAVDSDCSGTAYEACQTNQCPLNTMIVPTQNWQCQWTVAWYCDEANYGDGHCDCGCGVMDVDCAAPTADVCERTACGSEGLIHPYNNWACLWGWTCGRGYLGDGICDCGCGNPDPDCATDDLAACVRDHCPMGQRPALEDSYMCVELPDWTCYDDRWGDGVCDCGCGSLDSDCTSSLAHVCERSRCTDSQPSSTHNWLCADLSNWTCGDREYDDGICDCGCGSFDVDCDSAEKSACGQNNCPFERSQTWPLEHRNWLCSLDATGPSVGFTSPMFDQQVSQAELIVKGEASDPLGIYKVTLNDLEAEIHWDHGVDVGWRRTIILEQGDNLLLVRAEDYNGNVTTASIHVFYEPAR